MALGPSSVIILFVNVLTKRLALPALAAVLAACGSTSLCGGGNLPIGPTAPPKRPPPALVQVENAPQSRPHSGLQRADLVYEYLTEGGITRLTVIYFSPSGSDKVGPVRSARLVALRLQKSYGGILFYSGASDHVLGLIEAARVPALDENSQGGRYFFRDRTRPVPHNLYTDQGRLLEAVQQSSARVDYQLPAHGEPPKSAEQVTKLSFQQTTAHSVAYTYSPDTRTYSYQSETGPEVDTENGKQPIQVTNVVLIRVAHHGAGYVEDVLGEEGIDFALSGQGPADVYTRGTHLAARWDLTDPAKPVRLLDSAGKDLHLPSGLTWIHLVDPEMAVTATT
jgi:hypothetical protein